MRDFKNKILECLIYEYYKKLFRGNKIKLSDSKFSGKIY